MNIKAQLITLIQAALPGVVVHWTTTPQGFVPPEDGRFIVAQKIGGKRSFYVDQDTPQSHRNARIQFTCFAKKELDVDAMAATVENTIAGSGIVAEVYGEPINGFSDALQLRTAQQQFGLTYPV